MLQSTCGIFFLLCLHCLKFFFHGLTEMNLGIFKQSHPPWGSSLTFLYLPRYNPVDWGGGGRGIINKNQKKDNYFATLKPMHVLQQTLTICKHDWQTNTFHQFSDNNFNSLKHTSNASDNKAPSASQIRG